MVQWSGIPSSMIPVVPASSSLNMNNANRIEYWLNWPELSQRSEHGRNKVLQALLSLKIRKSTIMTTKLRCKSNRCMYRLLFIMDNIIKGHSMDHQISTFSHKTGNR